MMWIKGDRTECRTDITELEWTDNNFYRNPITVATEDADDILFKLNTLMLLENFLEDEDNHLNKLICDPKISPKDLHKAVTYKHYMEYLLNRWKQIIIEAKENGVLPE